MRLGASFCDLLGCASPLPALLLAGCFPICYWRCKAFTLTLALPAYYYPEPVPTRHAVSRSVVQLTAVYDALVTTSYLLRMGGWMPSLSTLPLTIVPCLLHPHPLLALPACMYRL